MAAFLFPLFSKNYTKMLAGHQKVPAIQRLMQFLLFARAVGTNEPRRSIMKSKAIFYHAGCPVCVAAEQNVAQALDPAKYDVEVVHLGTDKSRLKEAEAAGVQSVPALVMDEAAFHINFGAGIEALR